MCASLTEGVIARFDVSWTGSSQKVTAVALSERGWGWGGAGTFCMSGCKVKRELAGGLVQRQQ